MAIKFETDAYERAAAQVNAQAEKNAAEYEARTGKKWDLPTLANERGNSSPRDKIVEEAKKKENGKDKTTPKATVKGAIQKTGNVLWDALKEGAKNNDASLGWETDELSAANIRKGKADALSRDNTVFAQMVRDQRAADAARAAEEAKKRAEAEETAKSIRNLQKTYNAQKRELENAQSTLDNLKSGQNGDYSGWAVDELTARNMSGAGGNSEAVKAAEKRLKEAQTALEFTRQEMQDIGGRAEDAGFLERAGKVVTGSAKNIASANVNAAGTVIAQDAARRDFLIEEEATQEQKDYDRAKADYEDAVAEFGEDSADARFSANILAEAEKKLKEEDVFIGGGTSDRTTADKLEATADRLAASGANDMAAAKRNTSRAGQIAADIGSQVLALGGDALLNVLAPGLGMAAMGVRAFGGASQEARLAGADENQQMLYGLASSALEMLTEKMFDGVAGIYGKGAADDVVEKVIAEMCSTDRGRTVLRTLASMGGEGAEEYISARLEPVLQMIYDPEAVNKAYGTGEAYTNTVVNALYDAAIGMALGGFGSAVELANGQNAAKNAALRGYTAENALPDAGSMLAEAAGNNAEAAVTPTATADTSTASANTPTNTSTGTSTTPTDTTTETPVEQVTVKQENTPVEPVSPASEVKTEEAGQVKSAPSEAPKLEKAKTGNMLYDGIWEDVARAAEKVSQETPQNAPESAEKTAVGNIPAESGNGGTGVENGRVLSDTFTDFQPVEGKTRTMQTPGTVSEANVTSEARRKELEPYITGGAFDYIQDTNAAQAKRAEEKIRSVGWSKAAADFQNDVEAGGTSADLVALGAQLVNNISNSGASTNEYMDVLNSYIDLMHRTARAEQAGKILQKLTPEGRLYLIQRTGVKLNENLSKAQAKKVEKNAQTITADEAVNVVQEAKEKAAEVMAKPKNSKKADSEELEFGSDEFKEEAVKLVAESIEKSAKTSTVTQAETSELENFVKNVKKFVYEKLPKRAGLKKNNTATEILKYYAENQALFNEVYEKAQGKVRNDLSEVSDFVRDYLDSPIGIDGEANANNKLFMKAIIESAIRTDETKSRIVSQSALGVSNADIAGKITKDLIKQIGSGKVHYELFDAIRNSATKYVESIVNSSDVQAEKIVKSMVGRLAGSFKSFAADSKATKEGLKTEVSGILAEEYALDGKTAEKIADTVIKEYDRQLSAAMQEVLTQKYGERASKTRTDWFMQKFEEAGNLDAFRSEYAEKATSALFGTNGISLDPDLADAFLNAKSEKERNEIIDKITKDIAKQIPSTFGERFTALRYVNMLGNLKTQVRNVGGNVLMGATAWAKRKVQAATELTVSFLSSGKYERNTALAVSPKLFKEAMGDIANVKNTLQGEAKYSDSGKGIAKAIQDERQIFRLKGMEFYRKATTALMEGGDTPFLNVQYASALAGWMKAHGVKSIADATPEQLEKGRAFAIKEAQEATFHDSNELSDWVSQLGRTPGTPKAINTLLEGIIPFRKTPANVAIRAVEYSPVGAALTIYNGVQAIKGNKSGADVINSLSKTVTGSALAYAGYLMAMAGKARTKDRDEKAEEYAKMTGALDYSVNIAGKDVSLSQFAPTSIPFFIGVGIYEAIQNSEGFSFDVVKDVATAITDPLIQQSMLSGVNDALQLAASGDGEAAINVFGNAMLSYALQGVQNSLAGQIAQAEYENRQTTYTLKDNPLSKEVQYKLSTAAMKDPLGLLPKQNQDYIDAWGRTQSQGSTKERYINNILNPTYYSQAEPTPIDDELNRLHNALKDTDGYTSVYPQKGSRGIKFGDGQTMTPEEYQQYSIERGQKSYDLVSDFIESSQYKTLTDEQKYEVIKDLYSLAEDRALKTVQTKNGFSYTGDKDYLAKVDDIPGYLTASIKIYGKTDGEVTEKELQRYQFVKKQGGSTQNAVKTLYDLDRTDENGNLGKANGSFRQDVVYKYLVDLPISDSEKQKFWGITTTGKTSYAQYAAKRK